VSPTPTVSIVIPTHNRRERLHRVLSALAEQSYRGSVEVVVVSDGSTDGTDEYLTGPTPIPVTAVLQANAGPAAARNRGVHEASGELVLFLDDDVVPAAHCLAAHVSAHERLGDDAVVIGPMVDPPDHRMSMWVRWEQAMLARQYSAMERGDYGATARQFYTGNASLQRRHLLEAGGFDPTFRRAEDVELAYRLADRGLQFAFEPAAVGYHYAERSFDSWLATARAYGRNAVVFARDAGHPYVLSWVIDEYPTRHGLVRLVTRACLLRPAATTAVTTILLGVARLSEAARRRSVASQALSGIYGLAYYNALAEELGGREQFWTTMQGRTA